MLQKNFQRKPRRIFQLLTGNLNFTYSRKYKIGGIDFGNTEWLFWHGLGLELKGIPAEPVYLLLSTMDDYFETY
jgi:hypothetical protein